MRVCVDPGHGGADPGAVVGEVREADINLTYARELRDRLEQHGHDVLLTRAEDVAMGLSERARLANDWPADCLVSIHANASSSDAANGAWVIYDDRSRPAAGPALARSVFDSMRRVPGAEDEDDAREVYPDGTAWVGGRQLTVISRTTMASILVELGFMTNRDDMADLLDATKRGDIVAALADGIEMWDVYRTPPEVDLAGDDAPLLPVDGTFTADVLRLPAREAVERHANDGESLGDFAQRLLGDVVDTARTTLLDEVSRAVLREVRKVLGGGR